MATVTNPFTAGTWIMEPKPQNFWGRPHASWFFAMGIGGALFVNRVLFGMELGRVAGVAFADLLSIGLIAVGGLILIADLGKPLRVLRALMNPQTSWISVGAICDFIFLIVDGLWILADLEWAGSRPFASLPWAGNSPLGIAFQVIAVISAFIVVIYPGLVLAYSPSIPFWNTTLIPLQFLSFAFAGAFGVALLTPLWSPVPDAVLSHWLAAELLLLATTALLLTAHLLNGSTSHPAAKLSVTRLMRGELRGIFLLGTVFLGLAFPALFIFYGLLVSSVSHAMIIIIAAAVLVGNWFSKYAVIKAGLYAPFF
jgi:formate-dependent nitrite reductase membrane component NrfD